MADTRKDTLKRQFADQAYRDWLSKNNIEESGDYDTRGAFSAGVKPSDNGHLPDTYKLPNHITYSDESRASRQRGAKIAGKWMGSDKSGWTFYSSPTNVENAGGEEALAEYFRTKEPDAKLVLPR
jgi:hypothetical protein